MELREALSQIAEIRAQMAQTETFRGYRWATVAFSGLLAMAGAVAQALWIPEPLEAAATYLALWVGIGALSVAVCGVEMAVRYRRTASPLRRQMTRLAVEQFLPCTVAGALLTFVMANYAAEGLWMLPGLWAIVFSLGIFASCRLLPRQTFWAGTYYLVAGIAVLVVANGPHALSPWAMVGTFGLGQLLSAAILYLTSEHSDGRC